jgi:hypothetical protein
MVHQPLRGGTGTVLAKAHPAQRPRRIRCQLPRCTSISPTPPNSPKCSPSSARWLGGTDHAQLAASFGRFIGTQGYDLAELRTDLARFTFLLGHDDGEQLFGTGHS